MLLWPIYLFFNSKLDFDYHLEDKEFIAFPVSFSSWAFLARYKKAGLTGSDVGNEWRNEESKIATMCLGRTNKVADFKEAIILTMTGECINHFYRCIFFKHLKQSLQVWCSFPGIATVVQGPFKGCNLF